MNAFLCLALMSLSLSAMLINFDHHRYALLALQALEKRLADDYLIEGLLNYGMAFCKAHGGLVPVHMMLSYEPAGKDAQASLHFYQEGHGIKVVACIKKKNVSSILSSFKILDRKEHCEL